jgi:hypothetical protein
MTQPLNDEDAKLKKQQEFWERARKGVLKFLDEKGGKLAMSDLHEFSATKFFIQHQKFSEMMESFVNEGLAEFEWATQDVSLTELGKEFITQ